MSLDAIPHLSWFFQTVIYTSSVGNITKTVYNPEAIKAKVAITSPTAVGSASFVSKIEAIKRQEEKKKEMMKKKAELQKQKHELLLKQVEQQKVSVRVIPLIEINGGSLFHSCSIFVRGLVVDSRLKYYAIF